MRCVVSELVSAETILDFWFGPIDAQGQLVEERMSLWFGGGEDADARLRERFGQTHGAATRGELDAWADSPRGRLALILLLDQLTRSLYRGSAEAFAQDARALDLAMEALARGEDEQLALIERVFMYLPLEHSEAINHQALSVAKFRALTRQAPESARELYEVFERYAVDHHDLIAEYGRYPYRNVVLGRESTARERAYLSGGGATFGQG